EPRDAAGGRFAQGQQHFQQRGLAGSVGPQQGHDFSGLQAQVDFSDGAKGPAPKHPDGVVFDHPFKLRHRGLRHGKTFAPLMVVASLVGGTGWQPVPPLAHFTNETELPVSMIFRKACCNLAWRSSRVPMIHLDPWSGSPDELGKTVPPMLEICWSSATAAVASDPPAVGSNTAPNARVWISTGFAGVA